MRGSRLLLPARLHGPEAALPREDGCERRHPAADVLPYGGKCRPADLRRCAVREQRVKTRLLSLCVLCAVLPGVAAAAGPKITSLDTSGYPTVRATVVTPKPVAAAPALTENGIPVVGFRAVNLGREKSVAAVIDRSQSMLGQAMTDASAAARAVRRHQARPRPRRHLRGRPPRGPADELLVGDSRSRRRAAHDRGRQGPGHRALRLRRAGVAGSRSRHQPDADARAAHRRAGSLERRIPRAGDRGRPRGQRRRLSDRDREHELPARPAPAPRPEDGRPLRGRERDERPESRLRGPRRRSCAAPGSSRTSPPRGRPKGSRLKPPARPPRQSCPAWPPNRPRWRRSCRQPLFKVGPR